MEIMPALNHWLHLLSAVIWIGSLAFVVMILNPSLRQKLPREAMQHLVNNLRGRYLRIGGVLLGVVTLTGLANIVNVRHIHADEGGVSKLWIMFLGIKLALITGLFSIYLLNLLYRSEPWEEEQTEIPWARPSFVLGVLIILTAAFLRHAHPH